MRKNRSAVATGLYGASSWEHKWVVVDFSHDVLAGANTITKAAIVLPIPNTSLATGGPDAFPDALAAAVGARRIGSGSAPLAILTGVFVVHFTPGSPPTVYQPAGTTVQVFASSVVTTVGGNATALTGAFAVNAATNFIDPITITAPAERQVTVGGEALQTTSANLYGGDAVYVSYVTGGAIDPTGKVLAVILEFD